MTKHSRHIFIGSAWPYANGPLHLGHVSALLPADVLARYFRLRGDAVFFDSGSDSHGTPISVKAEAEGVPPADVATRYHEELKREFEALGFRYDVYSKTTTPRHAALVREIFTTLKDKGYLVEREQTQAYCEHDRRFLPDRYVEGTCPVCGFAPARGDQCDNCSSLLEPEKLLDPKCTLSGHTPVWKSTKHFFFQLSSFAEHLQAWVGQQTTWRPNALAFTKQFFTDGLKERAITRDIDWGVPVPVDGYEQKRIYVWFEAVCGYYTAHREFVEGQGHPDAWKPFWDPAARGDQVRHYYVHGKDNIPFHTIIWPSILLGVGGLHLPTTIVSSEYLTIEGKKLSTSRNWAVWVPDVLKRYQPDAIRYYLLANGPETRDADFSWDAFVAKTNNELVATYGNFVQRLTSFVRKQFPDGLPAASAADSQAIVGKAEALFDSIGQKVEAARFKDAIAELFAFLGEANRWLDGQAPWKRIQDDRAAAVATLAAGLRVVANLARLTAPFLPFQAERLAAALGQEVAWEPAPAPPTLTPLDPLFAKIDPKAAQAERAKLGQA